MIKLLSFFILPTLLLQSMTLLSESTPLSEAEGIFFDQATLAMQRGEYSLAMSAFSKVYDMNPKNTMARVNVKRLEKLKEKSPELFSLTQNLRKVMIPSFKVSDAEYKATLDHLHNILKESQEGMKTPIVTNLIIEDITPAPPLITYSLENLSWWDLFNMVVQAAGLDYELRGNTFIVKKID